MRDTIIKLPHAVHDVHETLTGVSGELILEWPFHPADLIKLDPGSCSTHASQLLEQYALNLESWALRPVILSRYPFLAGLVRVADA